MTIILNSFQHPNINREIQRFLYSIDIFRTFFVTEMQKRMEKRSSNVVKLILEILSVLEIEMKMFIVHQRNKNDSV